MAEVIKDLLKIKNKNIWTIEPGATVYDAISEMANKQIGALVVRFMIIFTKLNLPPPFPPP